MKNCPYCKIDVGGDLKKCPFCQSTLSGVGESEYFPRPITLRIKSFLYRLQQFLIYTAIILSIGSEFLLDIDPLHIQYWSLLITMWLLAFEYGVMRLFKRGFHASRVLTIFVLIVTILLMITSYQVGLWALMVSWALPIIIMGTMIANFVLAMIDQISNAMIYLLSNVFVGILPYLVLYFMGGGIPTIWIICLLVSVVLFVGAIIFKGRAVWSEIHRRFNV